MDYIKEAQSWAKNDAVRDAGLTTPDDVIRYDDLKYGDTEKWNLLDIYAPKQFEGKLPVIISCHGGGYFYGDKELYQHYCLRLAQRGFAVINFNYRLMPEHRYPAQLEDTFKVIDFMVDNAEKYNLDIDNVFMVGDSAGAHLCHQAGLVISNPEYAKLFDTFKVNEKFTLRGVAINCGMCIFVTKPFGPISMFKDFLPDNWRDYRKTYKVKKYMTDKFPPAFVMGAVNDGLKIAVKPLAKQLKKHNVEHIARIYGEKEQKEIGHVFHVNCRLELAKQCNDDQTEFFKKHIVR